MSGPSLSILDVAVRGSGGGGGAPSAPYTLIAAVGAFVLSGQVMTPEAGHVLSADVGSFVQTGVAAGLLAPRTLSADVGSFALSGEAMTPEVDYVLPADAGSFVESGVAAGLVAARTLTAAAGSFTLTGQDATLTYVAMSGSVWGDHGTNATLSTTTVANDTVTGAASSFSSVRGTAAWSTGKHYFEVKVLTAPTTPLFIIGLMDNATANGAPMDDNALPNSSGNSMFNGNQFGNGVGYGGVNLGAGWSLADGDVMAIALDSTNGFYYLALNNVWFLSGDPTSGATGTGAVGNGALAGARPMLSVWGASNGLYQLVTSGFTYTPPSGYSAWG